MGRFFPPSLAEWHSSVVGFGSGFAFGAAQTDSGVAKAFVRGVLVAEDESGHLAQAEAEAAYATACFVLGAVVGRAWSERRNA